MSNLGETTKTAKKTTAKAKASVNKTVKLPASRQEIEKLFEEKPELFTGLLPDQAKIMQPTFSNYTIDPFKRFETEVSDRYGLQQSIIPAGEGSQVKFALDNTSQRIALEQSNRDGISMAEYYRHAVWYFNTAKLLTGDTKTVLENLKS